MIELFDIVPDVYSRVVAIMTRTQGVWKQQSEANDNSRPMHSPAQAPVFHS